MAAPHRPLKDWLVPKKPARLLVLVGLLAAVYGGERWYRHWRPRLELRTEHYVIASSATREQTEEIGRVVELLHAAYRQLFADFPQVHSPHPPLRLKLFKDRQEFRRCNRGVGWAEAFYRAPYCHAYYSADEVNAHHWMVHEAAHQLTHEVARLRLARWLDEGLAEYFSTSRLSRRALHLGQVDGNTYPLWWLEDLTLTGDWAKDLAANQVIPLRAIVAGEGGPNPDEHFNLYYIHWWSLAHFLFHFENGRYRAGCFQVLRDGGTVESFERHIGPLEQVQPQWYRYLQEQTRALTGKGIQPGN